MKMTDKILPHITKELNVRSRNLKYVIHKEPNNTEEVEGTTQKLKTWRHTVDLDNRTCSCKRWQITGLPCTHAMCLINASRNRNVENYVDDYYSVERFQKAYEGAVMPMTDRNQWPKVDLGFKLWPPRLKRAAGRSRSRRIKGVEEGGKLTGQKKCRRCGQLGHMMKTCNETVYDSDAPPLAPPKPKKAKTKKANTTSTASTQQSEIGGCSMALLTNSPVANTRSRKRQLESGDGVSSPTPDHQKAKKLKQNKVHKKKVKKQLLQNLLSE
ncbi:unnamed protein product [Urochloa humidicola]